MNHRIFVTLVTLLATLIALPGAALPGTGADIESFDPLSRCEDRGIALEASYAKVLGKISENSPQEAAAKLSKLLAQAVAMRRIPGGSIQFGGRYDSQWAGAGKLSALRSPTDAVKPDTLYDIASLSKVVSTATAVHLLVEQGQIELTAPISTYIAELRDTRLGAVPVQRLLRHRGGTQDIATRRLANPEAIRSDYLLRLPRQGFVPDLYQRDAFQYTDAAYVLLGILVERVSGKSLDHFAHDHIFFPLGMINTQYNPPVGSSCAATNMGQCSAHDPIARAFGGVSGNAGVFSTSGDLARFAQVVLNDGTYLDASGVRRTFLSMASIRNLTTDPEHHSHLRGLGFDIDSPYACAPRGPFPLGSFGHTGYTGTSLWIDQKSRRFVVLLTNEVELGKGPIDAIRWNTAKITARYRD